MVVFVKQLFRLGFGTISWSIKPQELSELKQDLEEFGTVDIKSYKSKFSLGNKIKHSEPCEITESNHVDFLLNDALVVQFTKRFFLFVGFLFDENAPEYKEKIENILARYKYYTQKTGWKFSRRWRLPPLILSGLSFSIALLYAYDILSTPTLLDTYSPEIVEQISPRALEVLSSQPADHTWDIVLAVLSFVLGWLWIFVFLHNRKMALQ